MRICTGSILADGGQEQLKNELCGFRITKPIRWGLYVRTSLCRLPKRVFPSSERYCTSFVQGERCRPLTKNTIPYRISEPVETASRTYFGQKITTYRREVIISLSLLYIQHAQVGDRFTERPMLTFTTAEHIWTESRLTQRRTLCTTRPGRSFTAAMTEHEDSRGTPEIPVVVFIAPDETMQRLVIRPSPQAD